MSKHLITAVVTVAVTVAVITAYEYYSGKSLDVLFGLSDQGV